jgi:hypothetical protein
MPPKQALRDSFSLSLVNALALRYREIPSAAFVAKEFNLRTSTSEPITQESARRWLRGLAIPELDKLLVLRSWLDLDLNALGMPSVEAVEKRNAELKGSTLEKQEEFINTTKSIKDALQVLMKEVQLLEEKLAQEN